MSKDKGRSRHIPQMTDAAQSDLSDRIFSDLLNTTDPAEIGPVFTRVAHLRSHEALKVVALALGAYALLVQEVSARSASAADVVQEVRDGLAKGIVNGTVPKLMEGTDDGN